MKKNRILFFMLAFLSAAILSCSDDEKEVTKASDPDVTHVGEKWNITAVSYILTEQSLTGGIGQSVKVGTKGTGFFYFDFPNGKGSFELDVEGYHKEDVFTVTLDGESVTIQSIAQSTGGGTFSQNILAASGDLIAEEINLNGTITKQSTSGQFVLAIESLTLVKE